MGFELTQENLVALMATGAGAAFTRGIPRIIFGIAFAVTAARATGLVK